jgi:hypothetical protein
MLAIALMVFAAPSESIDLLLGSFCFKGCASSDPRTLTTERLSLLSNSLVFFRVLVTVRTVRNQRGPCSDRLYTAFFHFSAGRPSLNNLHDVKFRLQYIDVMLLANQKI